uniref:Uncharacterized protein n=1 Tax=Cacopsylla melanoneura TaxID=428564 RepID=A0A8D9AX85_9HEMI
MTSMLVNLHFLGQGIFKVMYHVLILKYLCGVVSVGIYRSFSVILGIPLRGAYLQFYFTRYFEFSIFDMCLYYNLFCNSSIESSITSSGGFFVEFVAVSLLFMIIIIIINIIIIIIIIIMLGQIFYFYHTSRFLWHSHTNKFL